MVPTATPSLPPKSCNGARTAASEPSGSSRHVAVRGIPWAPPDLDPTAATRPRLHATESRISREV